MCMALAWTAIVLSVLATFGLCFGCWFHDIVVAMMHYYIIDSTPAQSTPARRGSLGDILCAVAIVACPVVTVVALVVAVVKSGT